MALLVAALTWGATRWRQRWREEAVDRRVAITVDWNEFRELSARQTRSRQDLLQSLRARGVTAVLLAPTTLEDLAGQHRVRLHGLGLSGDNFDVSQLEFQDPVLARQAYAELERRGVNSLELQDNGILRRSQGTFSSVKEIDLGADPVLVGDASKAGLVPVFRAYRDPWVGFSETLEFLGQQAVPAPAVGILFTSDDLPGGPQTLPFWRSWIRRLGATQFLLEFHPAKASWLAAQSLPAQTYRAHTIPVNELKDLNADQQIARWRRAVEERSCRMLLVHVPPNASLEDYLSGVQSVADQLIQDGWILGFPRPRPSWPRVSDWINLAFALLAWIVAVLSPVVAFRSQWPLPAFSDKVSSSLLTFAKISGITWGGALLVAALAQNPYTRLEISPFRGIKLAFVVSWLLCLFFLYHWSEVRRELQKTLRRWEIVLGVLIVAAVGYLLIRSGNAPVGWKNPWELPIRDFLEATLFARPRFKEFLIGHPCLLTGLYLEGLRRANRWRGDARVLIWLGLLGQISLVNTFCHLHTPLRVEMLRTFNGLWLGSLLGLLLIGGIWYRVVSVLPKHAR
jgi:hypothetical protein